MRTDFEMLLQLKQRYSQDGSHDDVVYDEAVAPGDRARCACDMPLTVTDFDDMCRECRKVSYGRRNDV
jgi:hypothetical protein